MYRQIYFKNSLGQTFGDGQTNLFANLQGFGFQNTLTGTRVGNSLLISQSLEELVVKSTELMIWSANEDIYQLYLKFARFVQYEPLYLYYKTPNKNEAVFCQVKITQCAKGEVGQDGIMRVALNIQPLTFWFDETENVISTGRTENIGKTYPLKRPYVYSFVSTSNITLFNDGIKDAPMIIEVEGSTTDLLYNLYDEQGKRYGVGKFNGTFDSIVVNSFELDESITLMRDGAVLPNPYNYQDLNVASSDPTSRVTFLKLKSGKSTMNFNVSEGFNGTITVRWRNTYATV